MAACEKCWAAAGGDPAKYQANIDEGFRTGKICTPEEQAGPDAGDCPKCNRKTVHQFAHVCMICDWRPGKVWEDMDRRGRRLKALIAALEALGESEHKETLSEMIGEEAAKPYRMVGGNTVKVGP